MHVNDLHSWDVAPEEARVIQRDLQGRVSLRDGVRVEDIRYVAGADCAYARRGAETTAWAAVLVFTFPELELVETRVTSQGVTFPYVPGLLSFREGPALLAAFRMIETTPDVVLFDAQGIAHPRRLGAASHIGLFLDVPSIGCAKSRLTGRYAEPRDSFGAHEPLMDGDEPIGAVVRTRTGRGPLFVSPGHRISVATAVKIALACCHDNRFMPEPTRQADKAVGEAKKPSSGER